MLSKIVSYLKYKYFLYFFALVAGWPCVFYLMGWLPHYIINYIVLFVFGAFIALKKGVYRCVPRPILYMLLCQIFFWFWYSIIYLDSSYFTRIFMLLITLSILGIQFKSRDKKEFIKVFDSWLGLQVICGAVGFLLVIIGLLKPLSEFIEMDGRTGFFYGLFTTNAVFGDFVRNAGFYDEPGALACWGVFALLLNKLYIDNKKLEYSLIIGLISTLSMAFFIQLAFYVFFFYKKHRLKSVILSFFFLLILIGLVNMSDEIGGQVFGRFVLDPETNSLSGDNRTEVMEKCWMIFSTAPIIGVGATNLATVLTMKEGFLGANFFTNWASDGIIGVLVTYLPLFFLFRMGLFKSKYFYAATIILLGYLQRPYSDTILLFPLVLYVLVSHAYLDFKSSKYMCIK